MGPFWQVRGGVAPHAFGRKSRERVAIHVRALRTKLVTFARYEKRREAKLSAWRADLNSAKLLTDGELASWDSVAVDSPGSGESPKTDNHGR